MKPPPTVLSIAVLVFLANGCLTRTYVSHGEFAPDRDTRLVFTGHGAYGHAYVERTKKLFDVWIGRSGSPDLTTLFAHRYRFVGADLWGDVKWTGSEKVAVQVYDYGDGISSYDAERSGIASNRIATLSFHLDRRTGKFIEDAP